MCMSRVVLGARDVMRGFDAGVGTHVLGSFFDLGAFVVSEAIRQACGSFSQWDNRKSLRDMCILISLSFMNLEVSEMVGTKARYITHGY